MTIWRYGGAVLGGAGGFLVGGPAGAVAGGSAGYSGGKAIDDKNAADAAAAEAAAHVNDPNGFSDSSQYGYGGFTPEAQNQQGYYSTLGQGYANTQAPQLQRTGIDYSGGAAPPGGNGGGGAPQQQQPAQGGAPQPGGSQPIGSGGYYAPGQRPITATQGYTNAVDSAKSVSSAVGGVFPGASTSGPASQQPPAPSGGAPDIINPGGPAHGWQPGSGKFGDTHVAPGPGAPPGQQGPAGPTPQGPTGPTGEFANKNYQNQMDTRGQQNALVSRLTNDLNGSQPSAAQAQLKSGIDQSIAAQNAMAASAGPGNYAAAQRQSMTNAATAGQQAVNQSAILRAQEYQQGVGALGSAVANERAADLGATGMSYQNAVQQAQLQVEQNKTQAGLEMGQRGLNLQGQLGMYGMANQIGQQDLASRMHYADLMASKYANDRGLAQQQSQFNTGESDKWTGAALQGASTLAAAYATS